MKKILLLVAVVITMGQAGEQEGFKYEPAVRLEKENTQTIRCEKLRIEAMASIFMSAQSETIGEKRDYLIMGLNATRRMKSACLNTPSQGVGERVWPMIYEMFRDIEGIPRDRPVIVGSP